jgi:hypothetical protein
MTATFDIRFTPNWSYDAVTKLMEEICTEAGPNVTYELIASGLREGEDQAITRLDEKAWWWANFQEAFRSM